MRQGHSSTDKSFVGMEQRVCAACGQDYDTGAILIDRRMRPILDHHQHTGLGMCPTCKDTAIKNNGVWFTMCEEKESAQGKQVKLIKTLLVRQELCERMLAERRQTLDWVLRERGMLILREQWQRIGLPMEELGLPNGLEKDDTSGTGGTVGTKDTTTID